MRIGRLHVITDTTVQSRWSAADLARMAVAGGADTVQLREKSLPTRSLLEVGQPVAEACRRKRVPFLVNDRADVAWALDADGVHLGDDDLPIPTARLLLGSDRTLGASADTLDEIRARRDEGADYVGLGPAFATRSKQDTGPALGVDGLARIMRQLDEDDDTVPVIAIGGITLDNVGEVMRSGVHGVAVLSAICWADDPEATVRAFRAAIDEALSARSGSRGSHAP